jgi:hypothetical protein
LAPLESPLDITKLSSKQIAAIKVLFARGNLDPILNSKQLVLSQMITNTSSEDFLVFNGRQWGKTHWGLCQALSHCIKHPGSRVLYYAPVRDKLADIINDGLDPILQWAPEGLIQRRRTSHRWIVGRSELRLLTLERAHVNKARGLNAKGLIVIEEGCFTPSQDFQYALEAIIEPQRLRHKPKLIVITTPSVDEDHYVHTTLLPRLAAQRAVANFTIYDNPFLTQEQILKVKSKVTDEVWRREYMAEIFRSKDMVAVPEFEETIHVVKLEAPPYANWITSIDFGGSIDPHGIALSYYDTNLKKWCVFKETLVPVNTSIAEVTAAAIDLEKHITNGRHDRVVDCSGQVSIELARLNFSHFLPTKGPGSFDASLQAMRVGFQNSEILVDESCRHTIAQLKYGKLNKQRNDLDRTSTHHNDLIASLMYGFKHRFTHSAYPHTFGIHRETHLIHPKQKSPLLQIGHQYK